MQTQKAFLMPDTNHVLPLMGPLSPIKHSFWREVISPEIFSVQFTPRCFSATLAKAQRITENHSSEGHQHSVLSHGSLGKSNKICKLRSITLFCKTAFLSPKPCEL